MKRTYSYEEKHKTDTIEQEESVTPQMRLSANITDNLMRKSSLGDLFAILTNKDEHLLSRLSAVNEVNDPSPNQEHDDDINGLAPFQPSTINNEINDLDHIDTIDKEEGKSNNVDRSKNRSFLNRYFSPLDVGSLRSSIFNLVAYALGVGCQTIPFQITKMSFLAGLLVISICSVSSYWTLNLLFYSAEKRGIYDYSKLVKDVLGKKMSLFLNINIIVYITGSIIAYQINSIL